MSFDIEFGTWIINPDHIYRKPLTVSAGVRESRETSLPVGISLALILPSFQIMEPLENLLKF